jgi:hypothetical protein
VTGSCAGDTRSFVVTEPDKGGTANEESNEQNKVFN